MKRNHFKKIALVIYLALAIIPIIGLIKNEKLLGSENLYDFDTSNSWNGNLPSIPLDEIDYDSQYIPFSEITGKANPDPSKIYVIETATDLYYFSYECFTNPVFLGLNYVLGKDIDYYEAVMANPNHLFIPIGFKEELPFTGSFNGQGFEITNLYYQTISTQEEYDNNFEGLIFYSMFSVVGATGVIRNLGLINPIMVQPINWDPMMYASPLVGLNQGLIEHVYVEDNRGLSSGLVAEGGFHIAGLVSYNEGTIRESYVATQEVKSQSIKYYASSTIITTYNRGTIKNVYFDSTLHDPSFDVLPAGEGLNGEGLATSEFQNHNIFDDDVWYYNDYYSSKLIDSNDKKLTMLDNVYPTLRGIPFDGGKFEINNALDFVWMMQLLEVSSYFRNADYVVNNDIDMNMVSISGYRASKAGFSGTLVGKENPTITLIERDAIGGAPDYPVIINLSIRQATEVGNFASYGLFSVLFGTISNLNFVNMRLETTDLSNQSIKEKILVGLLAAQINGGTVQNVHIHGNMRITTATDELGLMHFGGLFGEGRGTISKSTLAGNMEVVDEGETNGFIYNSTRTNFSAVGGLVGYSEGMTITETLNKMNITGFGFNTKDNYTIYLGGIIGYGAITSLNKVVFSGDLKSHNNGYVNNLYMGGIVGRQTDLTNEVRQIHNKGKLTLNVNSSLSSFVAGYGTIDGINAHEETRFKFYSLTNTGKLELAIPSGQEFTPSDLAQMNIKMAGVVFAKDTDAEFVGLFNGKPNQTVNLNIDLSFINSYASVINVIDDNNNNTNKIHQSYNYVNINAISTRELNLSNIKISGNILGKSVSVNHLRNDGNITVNFSHQTNLTNQGKFYIVGLIEEVSQNHSLKNGFNGGNITINGRSGINYDIYASGIAYKNANTNFLTENGIVPVAIEFDPIEGPIHNTVNNGNLVLNGPIDGSTRLSGIVSINESIITSAANLGSIDNLNDLTANHEIASGGLVYLMAGPSAQIRDSVNYGEIKSVSMTANGYSHAAGLAVRNDINEDGTPVVISQNGHFAKIVFSINYGDVFAWNGTVETSYGITSETRSKAAGVLTMGLLSTINNINYGNIYSRYLASGLFGFVYLNRFAYINSFEVFISNSINYGKIRELASFNSSNPLSGVNDNYPYQSKSKVRAEKYKAFGALIGKIHTGSDSWQFLSLFDGSPHPMDTVYFGYLINFDKVIDIAGNAPTVNTSFWREVLDGDTNKRILSIVNKMATVNPNDCSVEPFNVVEQKLWGITLFSYGRQIEYFYLVEDNSNPDNAKSIFGEDFALRSPRMSYAWTDRYLYDYFEFIPRDKASDIAIGKIETLNGVTGIPGLYALSNSKGIKNGVFLPDQIQLNLLNPISEDYPEGDSSWQQNESHDVTIGEKLTVRMRQIKNSLAANVYDIKLKARKNGQFVEDFILENPEIDERNGMITFYLPSNSALIQPYNTRTYHRINRVIEASQGMSGVIGLPNIENNGIVYVGTHYFDGESYHPLNGRIYNWNISGNNSYKLTFQYNSITIYQHVYTRASAIVPLVIDSTMEEYIYTYEGRPLFGSGYTVSGQTAGAKGLYPYQLVNNEYHYVGPYQGKTYILEDSGDELIGIFAKANDVEFMVDYNDDSSYWLSENAIIDENSQPQLATIPRYYGIYDTMADKDTGEYLDTAAEHYGKLRVYSEEYQKNPSSLAYKDYTIRIIRTADEEISSIDSLTIYVNGEPITIIPPESAVSPVSYIIGTSLVSSSDRIVITYNTLNMAPNYNVLNRITIYKPPELVVDSSTYDLRNGIVELDPGGYDSYEVPIPKEFNNSTGEWGTGKLTVEYNLTSTFRAGNYLSELKLSSYEKDSNGNPVYENGNIVIKKYQLAFTKDPGSEKDVLSFIFNGDEVYPNSTSYTSYIPYGIYYNPSDLINDTSIVDFSNLSSISDVIASDLVGDNIPSYLDGIEISPLATLVSVSVSVEVIDQTTSRHRYTITYVLKDENQQLGNFYHYLEEYEINPSFDRLYKNGGPIDLEENVIAEREESPTVRVEFDLRRVYFPNLSSEPEDSLLKLTPDFNWGEYDIYYTVLPGLGFEIDLFKDIPMGDYEFSITYESDPGIGLGISWHFTFDSLVVTKIKNNNSKLTNISFVTDSIFVEFNTIIDITKITEEIYDGYLRYPETRKILTLPTVGIQYNEYGGLEYKEFYLIGQVDKTDLTNYTPTFFLPVGATIYRVVNEEGDLSLDLTADFTPLDDGENFNYVHYRVFAEDYDENLPDYQDHYTDFHIAIMDVSNNVFIMPEIIKEDGIDLENVFVTFTILNIDETTFQEYRYSMSLYSYFIDGSNTGINYNFVSTMDGIYSIYIDLPNGYYFEIDNSDGRLELIDDNSFNIADSLIPRRVQIRLIIKAKADGDWGQNVIIN